jgi:hypothetical protein
VVDGRVLAPRDGRRASLLEVRVVEVAKDDEVFARLAPAMPIEGGCP